MKKNIYVFNNGDLKRKDNTIYFQFNNQKKYLPVEDISQIYVFGEVSVTKKFLEFCTQNSIMIHFFNYHEYYVGTYYPREYYNSGYMILKQAEYYLNEEKRYQLASIFVKGSINNILTVLKYYKNREKDVSKQIDAIIELSEKINNNMNIEQLMAIEGNIREIYYVAFDIILKKENFIFEKRTKRPPMNKLNSLISFGNSILYTVVLAEIYNTHLDARIGYLHTTNNRRFTLNLDVAEIFKPIIIDRVIFTLISKNMLTDKHFDNDIGGILLNAEGKKIFLTQLEEKLKTTLMQSKIGRNVSYRRLIRLELYKLEKHFMGEEVYKPYVHKW